MNAEKQVSITLCQTANSGCIQFFMTAFDRGYDPLPQNPASQEILNPSTVLNLNDIYSIGYVQVNTDGVECGFGDTVISIIPYSLCGGNFVWVEKVNGQ